MNSDIRRIRQRYSGVNLDDYEAKLIDALADYTGVSKATLLRQLIMKEALETLGVSDIVSVGQRGG